MKNTPILLAFMVISAVSHANSKPAPIEAKIQKDAKTSEVISSVTSEIDQPPAELWKVFTSAMRHGKLSNRTKECVPVPEAEVKKVLGAEMKPILPVPDADEKRVRNALHEKHDLKLNEVPLATPIGENYAYRLIKMPILLSDRWFVAREKYDTSEAAEGRYRMSIEGLVGNVKSYGAEWRFEPGASPGSTRVSYAGRSHMGVSPPEFLLKKGEGELRFAIQRLRELAGLSKGD